MSAEFKNDNAKSWFQNNLGRLLCKKLIVKIGGEKVYDNIDESQFMVYKDLWESDEAREDTTEYGIAGENLRELMSKDDSADTSNADDNRLYNARENRVKVKLGKILRNHGLFAPHGVNSNVEYTLELPTADDIMVAQS